MLNAEIKLDMGEKIKFALQMSHEDKREKLEKILGEIGTLAGSVWPEHLREDVLKDIYEMVHEARLYL